VVDWNKEVKLSDLLGRKKKDAGEASESLTAPEALEPQPAAAPPVPTPPPAAAAPPVPDTTQIEIPTQPVPTPAAAPPAPAQPPVPAPVPPPAPGVNPPVPADELEETVADDAEKVPFWKREISFGGGKAKRERAPKQPKQPKQKQPKQKQPKAKREKQDSVPFYKRELSFGRKKDAAPVAEAADGAKPRARKQKPLKPGAAKRQKKLVGLKLGGSQLAAARVSNNGVPELVQVARTDLEPGIIVGGELRDPDTLAEALKTFFKEHKLPRQGVRLGIANNRIGVRIFDIAGIEDARQLENAIRFRAQEALPIPIEEAVLDYHVLDDKLDEEGTITRRILLVVAYRDLVDRYIAACKKAGIKLAGIDLEAFALLRALAEPPAEDAPPSSAALVVVSIGHDRSTFAVSDGRVCEFTRVLDWGGAALNVAVARALDIAPSEAEPFKRVLSLSHEDTPEGMTDEQAIAAREALRKQLQAFARELVSSLQFYQNQPGSLGIGEIVITGGTAHLHGLADELQKLIGVRVRVGDPLTRVKLGKRVGEAEQLGSFAVAIGLGIED
jgi:type IV pilus assembly protein PilM